MRSALGAVGRVYASDAAFVCGLATAAQLLVFLALLVSVGSIPVEDRPHWCAAAEMPSGECWSAPDTPSP